MCKKLTTEEFIYRSSQIHGDKYDYSKAIYLSYNSHVTIICKIHGEFNQIANNHYLRGDGCPKCVNHITVKDTPDDFISKASQIHNNVYDYSKTTYIRSKTPIIVTCHRHGDFNITPTNHLQGRGCPKCKMSKGESKIYNFLHNHNIEFTPEHTFPDCKNVNSLYFDFYIPTHNMCIEFDGLQHFEESKFFGFTLKYTQLRDNIKTQYCIDHDIKLLRIPYWELKNIPTILQMELL